MSLPIHAARAANGMSAQDYKAALIAHLPVWLKAYSATDNEFIVAEYLQLLLAFAAQTPRVSATVLQQGVRLARPDVPEAEAHRFAQGIASAFSVCWKKRKTVTSGKRQAPEVQALLAVMRMWTGLKEEHSIPLDQPQAPATQTDADCIRMLFSGEALAGRHAPPPAPSPGLHSAKPHSAADIEHLYSGALKQY